MAISPTSSAIMCDGMGWFDDLDYKRMLLSFDEILYLLPKNVAKYRDAGGATRSMVFPLWLQDSPVLRVHHFLPDRAQRELISASAEADSRHRTFRHVVGTIPPRDRMYTWQIANADGDLTEGGNSPALSSTQVELAHGLLLNKFLLAADAAHCVPITGKSYVHEMLVMKASQAVGAARQAGLNVGWLRTSDTSHGTVVAQLIQSLVPDDQLAARSWEDIVRFKDSNRELFERFSVTTRKLVSAIEALPGDSEFQREVEELIATDVWVETREIEAALRSAWSRVFKDDVRDAVTSLKSKEAAAIGGAIGLGVLPLSLEGLTLASVAGAGLASASWAHSKFLEYASDKRSAKKNGLYFLMKFVEAG